MSLRIFISTSEKRIAHTEFLYKDIIPGIKPDDMFFNGKISFVKDMNDTEKATLGDLFNDYNVYAVHSDFGLGYKQDYSTKISKSFAQNTLKELIWFKNFARKLLVKNDLVLLIPLLLGRKNNRYNFTKTEIEVNEWTLGDKIDFEFKLECIYQFIDNSESAIERRKNKL